MGKFQDGAGERWHQFLESATRRAVALTLIALVLGLAVIGQLQRDDDAASADSVSAHTTAQPAAPTSTAAEPGAGVGLPGIATLTTPVAPATSRWRSEPAVPARGMLIAHYGTAGSGALGVLGERSPRKAHRRLVRAAQPFARQGRPVRLVYELIVTIADAHPGPDGDYSHDIARHQVRRYVEAARKRGALLVLDIQTGRSSFLEVARRWRWALKEPHVGLALDPEWRMGRHQVPGRVIGSVRAREVNKVSKWLSRLVVRKDLPEKVFVLHQFRTSMLPDVGRVKDRRGLALVQHVDGFGNRQEKLNTYRAVARPKRFAMGFKLFYDEDTNLMDARAVHRIRPRVRFVSYQ